MSKRFMSSADLPFRKDAEGRPLCRWCGIVVTPPRRSWCSKECVDQFLMRSSAETMRAHMFRRDKGICAACGCDTEKLQRILSHAASAYQHLTHGILEVKSWQDWTTHVVWKPVWDLGFNRNQTLWEADHIVEICNGGETTLENMQTLCVPCHKQKTRKMHADRARARRGKAPLPPAATQIALIRS